MLMLSQMTAIFFAALSTENIFFARAMDAIGLREFGRSPKKILYFGGTLSAITLMSALVLSFVDQWIHIYPMYYYIASIVYIAINGAVYIGAYWGIKKYIPKLFEQVGSILPCASINCVVLGSLLVAARDTAINTWWKFITYGLGSSVGFVLALLLFYSVEQRLRYCEPPKAFRGLPIRFITIGMIAMAIAGLVGNQLPA